MLIRLELTYDARTGKVTRLLDLKVISPKFSSSSHSEGYIGL